MKVRHVWLMISILFLLQVNLYPDDSKTILLKNGDKISGIIVGETSDSLYVKTSFGKIGLLQSDVSSIKSTSFNAELHAETPELKLNQDGRWRTIYTGMTMGSILYGIGIPHVLNINDPNTAYGLRLIMISGGFYASYKFTKGMDISLGRWTYQTTGAILGGFSALPVVATVGFDNWDSFDPDAKLLATYMMVSTPLGMYYADKIYKKWQVTDPQASLIAGLTAYGAGNAAGIIAVLHPDNVDLTEGYMRPYTLITYAGALGAGYLGYHYVKGKPYTEDDVIFIGSSASVGFINSIMLIQLLELDSRRPDVLAVMAGIDGFTYVAEQMVMKQHLEPGQGRIITLGSYAGYLAWLGAAVLLNVDYSAKACRAVDIASITAGWYYTYKFVTESKRFISTSGPEVSLFPTVNYENHSVLPGMGLNIRF